MAKRKGRRKKKLAVKMFWCCLMSNWVSECFEFDHYLTPSGYFKTNTKEASPTVQADSHFMVDCCSASQKNAIILWDEPTPKIHPVHVKVQWTLKMNLQHKLAMQTKQSNWQTASHDWSHHAAIQQANHLTWLVTSCSCPTGKLPHVTGHIMQLSNRQTASCDITSCSCPTGKPPHVTGHIMQLSNRQATSCDWSHHAAVQQASHLMWLVASCSCPSYTQCSKTTQLHGMLTYMKHNLRLFKKKLSKIIYSKQCMPTVLFLCVRYTYNDFTSQMFQHTPFLQWIIFLTLSVFCSCQMSTENYWTRESKKNAFHTMVFCFSASPHTVLALNCQRWEWTHLVLKQKFPIHAFTLENFPATHVVSQWWTAESHWPNLWHTLQESQWKELLPFGQD